MSHAKIKTIVWCSYLISAMNSCLNIFIRLYAWAIANLANCLWAKSILLYIFEGVLIRSSESQFWKRKEVEENLGEILPVFLSASSLSLSFNLWARFSAFLAAILAFRESLPFISSSSSFPLKFVPTKHVSVIFTSLIKYAHETSGAKQYGLSIYHTSFVWLCYYFFICFWG